MREPVPGEFLVQPVPVVAVSLLVLNDHLLKRSWPGIATGKLSDLAGLVFVPMLAVALVEVVLWTLRKNWRAAPRVVLGCLTAVGLTFVAAKVSPTMARYFGEALGIVRYPVRGEVNRVVITPDLTDLAALPAMLIAWMAIPRQRDELHPRPCTQSAPSEAPF